MKQLIVGSLVSVSLMLAACSGDPTEDLRTGISQLTTSPSTVFVQQGLTAKVQVSATDNQGNQIVTSYAADNVGSGITVARDETFQPVFVNDTTLQAPAEAATFQFNVNAVDLVTTSFDLTAGGKTVTVPVTVTPDPATVATATVTTAGATAADPTTLTVAAPFVFTPTTTIAFDAGNAIIGSISADGSTATIFAPPNTTTTGAITGLGLTYLPSASVNGVTDVPLTVGAAVPSKAGTASPATAPDITSAPAFFDGASFTGADITADGGLGAQYYAFTPAADGDFNITMDAQGADPATTDVDLVVCSDATCSDGGDFTATGAGQPETGTFTLTGGTTYYIAVILFAGAAPTSISLSVAQ
jgi:hypothetical protein